MSHFAAYFDILGTKEMVARGEFSDYHALDFSGAAIFAAQRYRSSRFAAFSDCVIFTTPADKPREFLEVLTLLFENWISDGIFVRGGVALGDVQWVDYGIDKEIKYLTNFSCARVYGAAINEAVEIERSSGPGVLAFASDAVADSIAKIEPDSVLPLASNILRSFEWANLQAWMHVIRIFSEHEKSPAALRHFNATTRVLTYFENKKA